MAPWHARLIVATTAASAASTPGQQQPGLKCDFFAGKAGSNACPGGAVMATLSECHGAGSGAGPVSVDSSSEPSGCFVYGGAHYYNANAQGAPSDGSAPFCKRCPVAPAGGEPAARLEESFNTYTCSADCPLWPGQLNTAEFRCFNGKCLPTSSYCDGKRDCADGSDEMHCSDEGGGAPDVTFGKSSASPSTSPEEDRPVDVTFGKSSTVPPGGPGAEPYDCHADFADWETGWTEARKEFCCKNYGGPCAAAVPPEQVQIYDCSLDVDFQQGWGAEKKDWCCRNEHVGCEPYECGEDEDPAGMDATHRAWCCQHLSRHCPEGEEGGPKEPYDCADGVLTWRDSWDEQKQEWCCEYHHLGCGKRGEANLTLTIQQLTATSEPLVPTTTASRTSTAPSSARRTSSRSSTSTTTLTTSAALSSTSTTRPAKTNASESSNSTRASTTLSTTSTVTSASIGNISLSTTTSTRKAEQNSSRPAQEFTTRSTTSVTASSTSVATFPPSSTTGSAQKSAPNSSTTASTTSTVTSASTGNASISTTTSTRKAENKSSRSAQEPSTRSTTSATVSRTSVAASSSSSVTESTVTQTSTTATTTTTDIRTTVSITFTTTSLTSKTSSRTIISTRTTVATTTSTRQTSPAATTSSEHATPPTSTVDATGLGADIVKAEVNSTVADTSTTRATAPLATSAITSTTLQPTSTQSASAVCSKVNSAYLPLDMLHHGLKRVASERECQERCARVDGCAHYSYWRPARHCHIQGVHSRQYADALFSSGPPECPAPPALVGKASVEEAALGADSPLLRGSPPAAAGGTAAGALAVLSLACAAGAALRGARGRTRAGQEAQERLLDDSAGVRSGRASPGPGDRAARWPRDPSVDGAYGELSLVAPEEHGEH